MNETAERSREMHFAIRFLTRYEYDADVVDNINTLRVRPAGNSRQRVDDFTVRLTPDVRQYRHEDYFGTEVVEFEVVRAHRELVIDVRARVTTQPQREPSGTTWEELSEQTYREAGGEFLLQTEDAVGHPLLTELAAEVGTAPTPLASVLLVSELIPDRFEYRKGATYVDSPLTDVLDGRAGVCQDFVHLGLIVLRRAGIAARYVSGYLFAASADGGDDSVEVDTHAWLEILLPDASGRGEPVWVGLDPTNRTRAGELYVKIGHGRHYDDVPPIKGVYRGGPSHLNARVLMTRLDPATSARA